MRWWLPLGDELLFRESKRDERWACLSTRSAASRLPGPDLFLSLVLSPLSHSPFVLNDVFIMFFSHVELRKTELINRNYWVMGLVASRSGRVNSGTTTDLPSCASLSLSLSLSCPHTLARSHTSPHPPPCPWPLPQPPNLLCDRNHV